MPFDMPIYAGNNAATNTRTVDLSTVTAGRGVVLWAAQNAGATSPSLSLAVPGSWVAPPDTGQTRGGWSSNVYAAWYLPPGATIPASVQVNSNTTGVFMAYAIPFYDIDVAVLDVDGIRGGDNGVSEVTIPSVTTLTDNVELLVMFSVNGASAGPTYGGGVELRHDVEWTGTISSSFSLGVASETWATAGPTGTRLVNPGAGGSRRIYAVMLPMKAASVAGENFSRTVRGVRKGAFR